MRNLSLSAIRVNGLPSFNVANGETIPPALPAAKLYELADNLKEFQNIVAEFRQELESGGVTEGESEQWSNAYSLEQELGRKILLVEGIAFQAILLSLEQYNREIIESTNRLIEAAKKLQEIRDRIRQFVDIADRFFQVVEVIASAAGTGNPLTITQVLETITEGIRALGFDIIPSATPIIPQEVSPVERPVQFERPQFTASLIEAGSLIRAPEARTRFSITGNGLTVAVLDTGLRTTHLDFAGRVVAQRNFTTDNAGNPNDASDGDGHGTNVAGIIAANRFHIGIAPGTRIIPLKVLSNNGGGSFQAIRDALQWVIDNRSTHNITAVCMSLGDGGNYTDDTDTPFSTDELRLKIQTLRNEKVAVVVAAGNDFFTHSSQQGMSYPAIFRETVSVGAVYDASEGSFSYGSGAFTSESGADRITPFSQRLHETVNSITRTEIFAPGAPITSSGILNDEAASTQHGTSQAAPIIAGVILLLQEYYLKETDSLPSIDDIETYLRAGGVVINDGDDEQDNVTNTGLNFIRVDVLGAFENMKLRLQKALFEEKQPLNLICNKS